VHDGADFSAYLVARWPTLVRTLVLLGSPYAEAEEVARDGLARCQPSWERERNADDIDVHVYRTVLERRHRRRRHPVSGAGPTPEPPLLLDPTLGDPAQRVALRHALEEALDGLPDEERSVLVLRFVAELSEAQVADVLGIQVWEIQDRQARGLGRLDLVALREVR
jgi:DNA-directed RNA polymerase specialized sigma24 family protein